MSHNGENRDRSNNGIGVVTLHSTDLILSEKTWMLATGEDLPKPLEKPQPSIFEPKPQPRNREPLVIPNRPGIGTIGLRSDLKAKGFPRYYRKMELNGHEVATKNLMVDEYLSDRLKLKDLSRAQCDANRVEVQRALEGITVETNHLGYRRRYKVIGVSTESADQLMFTLGTVQYSVAEYFKLEHEIELEHPALPCIQTGRPEKFTYLPMEVCKVVRTLEYLKELNQKLVSGLVSRSCNLPAAVHDNINKMEEKNGYSTIQKLNQAPGINASEMGEENVIARVLPPPRLKYHDSGIEGEFVPRLGHWNMRNKKMCEAAIVDQWTCLSFSDVDKQTLKQFCNELVAMCSSMGMTLNPPREIICCADPNQLEKTLLKVCRPTENNLPLQLLIIILPEVVPDRYGEIKRICETKIGIVSQCCKSRHLSKLSKHYLQSLALKINVKAGGSNAVLFDAIQRHIPLLTDLPTIIFGADVTDTLPGGESSSLIAAVVASMDWPAVSKYRGLVHAQDHRVEIVHLRDCVRDLLSAFCSANGEKPKRIIFFRDGVSDSQFAEVLVKEVDMIWQACKSIGENYEPQVTYVAVQKRHNTRLLPVDDHLLPADVKRSKLKREILPGTVVDTKICHPTEFNFYLCSHAGIQGKRPTLYHVLYDENNFTADLLQLLINSLCYTFTRCTQAVSVVPPAYYAHLLAYRARGYVEDTKVANGDAGTTSVKDTITKDKCAAIQTLPEIMDNVKNVMFYC